MPSSANCEAACAACATRGSPRRYKLKYDPVELDPEDTGWLRRRGEAVNHGGTRVVSWPWLRGKSTIDSWFTQENMVNLGFQVGFTGG